MLAHFPVSWLRFKFVNVTIISNHHFKLKLFSLDVFSDTMNVIGLHALINIDNLFVYQ